MLGSSRALTRPMLAAGLRGPRHSARPPGFPLSSGDGGACRLTYSGAEDPHLGGCPLVHTEAPETLPVRRCSCTEHCPRWAQGQGPARQSAPWSSCPARAPRRHLPTRRGPSLPGPDERRRPRDGGMAQGHRAQLKGIPVVKAEELEQQNNVILGYNPKTYSKNSQWLRLGAPNTGPCSSPGWGAPCDNQDPVQPKKLNNKRKAPEVRLDTEENR